MEFQSSTLGKKVKKKNSVIEHPFPSRLSKPDGEPSNNSSIMNLSPLGWGHKE